MSVPRKNMNKHILAACLLSISISGHGAKKAWWLTDTYHVAGREIESVPVEVIDTSWDEAMILSHKKLSPEGQEYFSKHNEYTFSLSGDFNKDGKNDKVFAGVYRDKAQNTGRFILILSEIKKNKWEKLFLQYGPGTAGFHAFRKSKGIFWTTCCECDHLEELRWNGKNFEWIKEQEGY